jgi:hypothetical protein
MTTPDIDDDGDVTLIDALHEDAGALEEYPAGCPELTPYLKLRPRSRRSQFKRQLAEVTKLEDMVRDLNKRVKAIRTTKKPTPEGAAIQLRLMADVDDMYQEMDTLLSIAAVDAEAWREWSDNLADDNDLARVFQLYMKRSQTGEASSSAS